MKFLAALLILTVFNCDAPDQTQEREALDKFRKEIIEMAASSDCSDEYTCKYTGFGSKPCGGFWGYLVYSTSINEKDLLSKVARYNKLEKAYNIKYGIISDCSVVLPPSEVVCDNGKCKAIYH